MSFVRRKIAFGRILAGLLLSLVFFLSACVPEDSGAYDRGLDALAAGDYETAMTEFTAAEKTDGRKAESYRGQGLVYFNKGDYKYAAKLFSKSLSAMTYDNEEFETDVLFYRAESLMRNGQYEDAEKDYGILIEGEKKALAYALLGEDKLFMKDAAGAEECFAKAVEYEPDFDIYLLIYEAASAAGAKTKGIAYLEQALKLPCSTAEDYANYGKACFYLDDYDGAKEALNQAMDMGNHEAMLILGKVYLNEKDLDSAKNLYLRYRNSGIRLADCNNGLAMCFAEEGDYEKALYYIGLGISSQDPAAMESLLFNEIVIYERMNDFITAKHKMADFLKNYPLDSQGRREYKFLSPRPEG